MHNYAEHIWTWDKASELISSSHKKLSHVGWSQANTGYTWKILKSVQQVFRSSSKSAFFISPKMLLLG